MSKFFILKENIKTKESKLLEILGNTNLSAARQYAAKRYENIRLSTIETGEKLVCVSERDYNLYYKAKEA